MMGMSSGSNVHQPSQHHNSSSSSGLHPSLYLTSSDPRGSPNPQEPPPPPPRSSNSNRSPTESASSQETWPTAADDAIMMMRRKKLENDENNFPVIRPSDKISLRDIARERVDVISEKMRMLPGEHLEEIKGSLRVILGGTTTGGGGGGGGPGSQQREEFLLLQKLVHSRSDLTAKTLIRAHPVQLQILVTINVGIQAFLHPNISLSQTSLIEVFVYKRCRNIACQNPLPADGCMCEICTNTKGFCNLCMCVICTKFDFEVNTTRWIGCDFCSHWTHTDCAIRDNQIGVGTSEMLFRCRACNRTSELLGWVKDVFQSCAPSWDREALMRELDFVSRIFRGSKDSRGRKLCWKCEELIEKLNGGLAEATACRVILMYFQELEMDSPKITESIAPQEAFNRIAEVVQEAVMKMEMVSDEKVRMFKKARLALETCDRELEDKVKEVTELKIERERKKQQIDELESIVRLKQAEADMFQLKANEARREAERLKRIALAKSEKSEEEYASRYLKLRLSEAEAEREYLFEKIKLQESSRLLKNT